jgi:hypothetical protein
MQQAKHPEAIKIVLHRFGIMWLRNDIKRDIKTPKIILKVGLLQITSRVLSSLLFQNRAHPKSERNEMKTIE